MRRRASPAEYYVDKKELFEEILKYREQPEPRRGSDKIGLAFQKIARGLGSRSNFRRYTYVDEMIDDAIASMCYALPKFDPEKSQNPFGYFSRCALWAFLERIAQEKKEQYLKHKNFNTLFLEGRTNDTPNDFSMEVIDKYEKSMRDLKERKRTGEKSNYRLF
jgi:hypothetical protein